MGEIISKFIPKSIGPLMDKMSTYRINLIVDDSHPIVDEINNNKIQLAMFSAIDDINYTPTRTIDYENYITEVISYLQSFVEQEYTETDELNGIAKFITVVEGCYEDNQLYYGMHLDGNIVKLAEKVRKLYDVDETPRTWPLHTNSAYIKMKSQEARHRMQKKICENENSNVYVWRIELVHEGNAIPLWRYSAVNDEVNQYD